MSGPRLRCSSRRRLAVLLALSLVPLACSDREVDDGMVAEPVEHPRELLQRFEQACEDWCMLVDECGRDQQRCGCVGRDFSEEHVLCLEKATLLLECTTVLTCDEIDLLDAERVQDERCYGEKLAETFACYLD